MKHTKKTKNGIITPNYNNLYVNQKSFSNNPNSIEYSILKDYKQKKVP